jgi:hypothetical protein
MNTAKKIIVGAMLLALLALGALTGLSLPNGMSISAVPVARADESDNNPPPPFIDCLNPTPTPTPKQ